MALMSSLLLFVFVAYVPPTKGAKLVGADAVAEVNVKLNSSEILNKLQHKNIPLCTSPIMNELSDLQLVFTDVRCINCTDCMKSVLKVDKTQRMHKKYRSTTVEPHDEMLKKQYKVINRLKRDTEHQNKTKKIKPRKKSVRVTKYSVNGDVFGIKVKETLGHDGNDHHNETKICKIYSVKKSFRCDTPESETFLADEKRKANRKKKKKRKMQLKPRLRNQI